MEEEQVGVLEDENSIYYNLRWHDILSRSLFIS